MLKKELCDLIKGHKPKRSFVVDEAAAEQRFLVLRLPVGHCELNPIELIWAQIKGEVAEKNTAFRLKDVQALTDRAIQHVTPEKWRKACYHVCRVEEEYWKSDHIQEEMVEQLGIDIGEDEDDDDSASDANSEFEN